jgi:hypothetical protein
MDKKIANKLKEQKMKEKRRKNPERLKVHNLPKLNKQFKGDKLKGQYN